MFARNAEAVTAAYQQTWPARQYQIIRSSATIRHLYSCHTHAFKYLWEMRLGQSPQDFQCLGQRPVAGGGLRLIMPPHAVGKQEPVSIEIRLESALAEPQKILIETTFTWPKPKVLQQDENFEPASQLSSLEEYAANQVWSFLTLDKNTTS